MTRRLNTREETRAHPAVVWLVAALVARNGEESFFSKNKKKILLLPCFSLSSLFYFQAPKHGALCYQLEGGEWKGYDWTLLNTREETRALQSDSFLFMEEYVNQYISPSVGRSHLENCRHLGAFL
jgi:hypothetical protein